MKFFINNKKYYFDKWLLFNLTILILYINYNIL